MSVRFQRITPFLWFDDQAETAANFYVSIFDNSRIVSDRRYDQGSARATGRPEGSVMTIAFELDGQSISALNGGPGFKFNEAVSLVVQCRTQDEVNYYWEKLSTGGDEKAQQCGWLKDQFGLSWQIVPDQLIEFLGDADPDKARKAMSAMLQMKKLDIDALRKAMA